MTRETVSVTGKINVTLEIDWPYSFGEGATAKDIYTTASRECSQLMISALTDSGLKFRIIGDITPLMVILPVKKP